MDPEWNDSQPIYRQLRDRVVAMILDGVLNEGDPLPSVRTVAAEYRVNPLTVLKGYQQLVDEQLVETRRGRGMFVNAGARALLLQAERQKFLARAVAAGPRDHPAARPDAGGAAGDRRPRRDTGGGALKPWPASKPAACARPTAPRSPSTASTCASRRAASSASSAPTAPARPPRSTRSSASPPTRAS